MMDHDFSDTIPKSDDPATVFFANITPNPEPAGPGQWRCVSSLLLTGLRFEIKGTTLQTLCRDSAKHLEACGRGKRATRSIPRLSSLALFRIFSRHSARQRCKTAIQG